MDGLHILANLHRCRGGRPQLVDRIALRGLCIGSVERAGLTVVGDVFHQFPSGAGRAGTAGAGGVTGCVVLAESHLAIHTWPELAAVTLDLYVCNFSGDNSARARSVVDELVRVFAPEDVVRHDVPRG
ncbi:MAG: S-adenosylmethionine decarboxylase [Burkholderiales bacterium]|nr:S-adenosylmethionine decarboxylase [Burkholderiales bacterium]